MSQSLYVPQIPRVKTFMGLRFYFFFDIFMFTDSLPVNSHSLCYSVYHQPGFFQEKPTSNQGMKTLQILAPAIVKSKQEEALFFPDHYPQGIGRPTGKAVEAKKVIETEIKQDWFTSISLMDRALVMGQSVAPLIVGFSFSSVLLTLTLTGTPDGSKPAFFLLDQWVTKPIYLLMQPGSLLCLFKALRSGFLGKIGILLVVVCFGQLPGYVAKTALTVIAQENSKRGENWKVVLFLHSLQSATG